MNLNSLDVPATIEELRKDCEGQSVVSDETDSKLVASNVYGGMTYLTNGVGGYVLLLNGKPLYVFPSVDELHEFIDECNDDLEEKIGALKLHLTGCARCKRTVEDIKFSPCKTGIPMLIHARSESEVITRAKAMTWRKPTTHTSKTFERIELTMSWLSAEIKHIEGAGIIAFVNGVFVPNETKLDALVGDAPTAVDGLVTLVENDDVKLGPFVSSGINGLLNLYKPELEAEAAPLAAQGAVGVKLIIGALTNLGTKLQAATG